MNEKMLVENTNIGNSTINKTSTQVYGFETYCLENNRFFSIRNSISSEAIVGVFHQQSQQSETKDDLNQNYLFI
ncbi:hypothetical protein ESY88_16990 [Subsaximicrobium wynnwilliamsii]|uniref:hypothetical protein n=1 Tax=Subsaximicrobium wynnwilliamsii TaxID=291179 RepID=UPI0011C28991|nr:hypothetical protein [Subsaximicrobium wynnwilliamsii]TXD99765.1 hypothetical protein ESY88_20425 [Subsaximicrobium wynnwilliamsii]TXE01114.1 hypothetical protein ESY88_16990 [Subsaximicrobium wynnwilliamsii]